MLYYHFSTQFPAIAVHYLFTFYFPGTSFLI